jgi:hypothetical protein
MIKYNSTFYSVGLLVSMLVFSQNGSCSNSKMKASSNNSSQQSNSSPDKKGRLTGSWGGQGIAMEIEGSGANLNFDCATGSISEPMVPDSNGKFEVKGTVTRERGGPIRADETPDKAPASYSGVVEGNTLKLTITLDKNKEEMGTFTLTRGQAARIRRCL